MGIELCLNSVIPSLYIFTILSLFIIKCGIFETSLFSILTKLLFGFKGEVGTVYLLSLFCGYPIGARLINELYILGKISDKDAEKMLCFCINPGPAFCITVIGFGCYQNQTIGAILFVSCALTSILCIRFYHPSNKTNKRNTAPSVRYGEGLISAVNDSNKCLLSICGWVLLSTAVVNSLKETVGLNQLLCSLEVTTGAVMASKTYSIYFVAFLLGFGGFSVHLQVLSNTKNFKPKYYIILLTRIVAGGVTAGLTYILLKIFPQTVSVSTFHLQISQNSSSPLASACLILFVCSTFIFINKRIKSFVDIKTKKI